MKRIIALLLVLCFMGLALVACGGEPEDPDDEEKENEEEEEEEEDEEKESEEDEEKESEEDQESEEDKESEEEKEDNEDKESESKKPTSKPTSKPTAKPTQTEEIKLTTTDTDEFGQNELVSAIPEDLYFDGETVTILVRDADMYKREWGRDTVEGDELNDAILDRNAAVEANIGVSVLFEYAAGMDAGTCNTEFTEKMKADVNDGYHLYDIIANFGYYSVTAQNRTFVANLLDKDLFPYFRFEMPCWNQSIRENGTINGQNYVCAGDVNLSVWDFSMIIWHNKTLYEELKTPDMPENIQDLVLAGDWTLEHLYAWSTVCNDTSPNGPCGDQYGYYFQTNNWDTQPNDVIPYAWDVQLMKTNQDGTHEFTILENERAEEAVEMMIILKNSVANAFNHTTVGGGAGCTINEFTSGNVVFKGDVMFWDEAGNLALREMEDVYTLIPWPMFDENQENYGTTPQDCYSLVTVLDHYENVDFPLKGEAVSAWLQASTEYSYTNVRAMYHEKVIKGKTLALHEEVAEKSLEIFEMIIDNIGFEFWSLYSASLSDITHLFRGAIRENTTLKAKFEPNQQTYEDNLRQADIFFGLIEG